MVVKPSIFDNILFGELAPWKSENTAETKFRDILNNQVRINKDNPEQFFKALIKSLKDYSVSLKIDHLPNKERITNLAKFAELQTSFSMLILPGFYNKASEFYSYLISNETIRIRAAIATNVVKCKTTIDAEYQVCSLLRNLDYTIEQVAGKSNNDKLSLFVLHSLKISLFSLYEEIKKTFPAFIGTEALSENELINFIDSNFNSNKSIPETPAFTIHQYQLAKTSKKQADLLIKQESKIEQVPEKPPFIPKQSDFRTVYKGKLSYNDVINSVLFTKLEEFLYNYDFIDLEYNFTNKHDKKKELASIYRILIQKKYFKEKNVKHQSKFRDADYRQYLDHRYNVDTSQQFRKSTPEIIRSISDKYYWLDTLPACR